jgi:hypothetical protein
MAPCRGHDCCQSERANVDSVAQVAVPGPVPTSGASFRVGPQDAEPAAILPRYTFGRHMTDGGPAVSTKSRGCRNERRL